MGRTERRRLLKGIGSLVGRAENSVQNYVLQRLKFLENMGKCYYSRNNSFSGRMVRWNGSQGVVNNAKPGAPDILAVFEDGIYTGIEIKSAIGKQSPIQKETEIIINQLKGRYWIVRSPEDFETYLATIL